MRLTPELVADLNSGKVLRLMFPISEVLAHSQDCSTDGVAQIAGGRL